MINSLSALTLHLNSIRFLIFGIKFHLTKVLEQPGGGLPALNVIEICDRCDANVYNQRTLQADAHIARPDARPRLRNSSMFCIEK